MGAASSAYSISIFLNDSDEALECGFTNAYHFDVDTATEIPITVTVTLDEEAPELDPPYFFSIAPVIDFPEIGDPLSELQGDITGVTFNIMLTRTEQSFYVKVEHPDLIDDFAYCYFTISTNIAPLLGPLSIPMFVIDNQTIPCGGIYNKLCNLAARVCPTACGTDCTVNVSGYIVTNEDDHFDYTLIVNPDSATEEIFDGEINLTGTEGGTIVYPIRLNAEFTYLYLRFANDDESIVLECDATIRRWNSNIVNGIMCV